MTKKYLKEGDILNITLGYSEVVCYMRIAGQQKKVQVTGPHSCQIIHEDGRPDGAPILLSEAGFYGDQGGYYHHS